MSGLAEIKQWILEQRELMIEISQSNSVEEAYDRINDPKKEDWRNDLDDILLDDKPRFLDWLESQISPTIEAPEPREFIQIKAYSYIRNGKVINVRAHTRKKRK